MNRSIEELKTRAKKLHKKALSRDLNTLRHMKIAPSAQDVLKRKTCLNIVATKLGFKSWEHARNVISGTAPDVNDMGKVWYSNQCSAFLNNWFATYDEAKTYLNSHPQMYLLPYQKQYMVVAKDFIKIMGFGDEHDKHWDAIGHNLIEHYGSDEWHELIWHRIKTMRTQ